MLNDSNAMPTIAVSDLAKAQAFYEGVLGLTVQTEMPEAQLVVYNSGSGGVQVYVSDTAGSNKSTYATWEVTGIEKMAEALKQKGVQFEHYPDIPQVVLDGDVHVWPGEKAAWFTDPDGNYLCLHERL